MTTTTMTENREKEHYLGNPLIKKDGITHQYTKEEFDEYVKCMNSAAYFARNYIKVIHLDKGLVDFNLYPYQEKMFDHFTNNRFSIVLAARQSGKCASGNTLIKIRNKRSGQVEQITMADLHTNIDYEPVELVLDDNNDDIINKGDKLSDKVERKFEEVNYTNDYQVWTDTGWQDIVSSNKTIPYQEYEVTLETNKKLVVADTHIFFDHQLNEVFAKDCQGLKLYTEDGPKEVISVVKTDKFANMYDLHVNSEDHRYYGDGVLSHNSISSIVWLLHYAIFNPEVTIGILANKGSTAREMLGRITLALENLPFFLQPGCKTLNKGSIHFSNNSKIFAASTSSSSIRGFSLNCVYLDEFSFVNKAEEFYTSTYPVITSGSNTKVIITSTANGVGNLYYRLWQGAVNGTNEYKPFRIDWWDVPGRDEKWKEQTIANTSEIQFRQEMSNEFLGTGDTLISPEALLKQESISPIHEQNNVRIYEKPIENHNYLMLVDVAKGRGQDYSTFTIIDVSVKPFKQVAVYQDNTISPLLFPDIIYKYGNMYNEALAIVESNDAGQVVCNALYYELEYENLFVQSVVKANSLGVNMDKKVKRIGCSNIKDLIEQEKITILDTQTIIEMSTFVAKGSSYEASDGNHDDLMMNLVMFGWFTSTSFFTDLTDITLRNMLYEEKMKAIEEDLPPFGIIDDGLDEDKEVINGEVWISTPTSLI